MRGNKEIGRGEIGVGGIDIGGIVTPPPPYPPSSARAAAASKEACDGLCHKDPIVFLGGRDSGIYMIAYLPY